MKYVVLRDDDISYFTRVDWLERLYEPLLERGLPFALSVIPRVRADVSDPPPENADGKYQCYGFASFIPPSFRGKRESFDVGENQALLNFLTANPQVEVVQHGYAHEVLNGFREFEVAWRDEVEYRVRVGKELLQKAFGVAPRFFVPPWDTLSLQAVSILRHYFSGVSLTAFSHRIVPRYIAPKFLIKKWLGRDFLFWGRFLMLEHPGAYLNRYADPAKAAKSVLHHLETHSHYVLVNHHWEYFFDWTDHPSAELFSTWQKVLTELLARGEIRVVSFSELYSLLRGRGADGFASRDANRQGHRRTPQKRPGPPLASV